jgi:hypothetical protein
VKQTKAVNDMKHFMPVGLTDIPLADARIQRTIKTLRVAQFDQDPLFDAADSFRLSLHSSAVKREGKIIEFAIMDAINQTPHLRLLEVNVKLKRIPDVQFEIINTNRMVVLEIKRGVMHDSKGMKRFRDDLREMPILLQAAFPTFSADNIKFHIVFIDGVPRLREGLTPEDLSKLFELHVRSHILTARQRYSAAIKVIMRERGL